MIQIELHRIVQLQKGAPSLGLVELAGDDLLLEFVGLEGVPEFEVGAVEGEVGEV